jgi:hypothetical protein
MLLPARRRPARIRGFDRVRVDGLIGVVLLIEIELQVWLSPDVHHRVPAALGGLGLAVAVAVRRRWPSAAVLVGVGAVAGQDVFGGRVTGHAPGAIPAGIMVFYGAGAFLPAWRARSALALGVSVLFVDVLFTRPSFAEFFFTGLMLCLLPWTVGRILRERAYRERAYRESAERLDGEREPEQDRLGQELCADLSAGRAERPPEPDLRAAFEHADDHDVRHTNRAHEQRDGAEPEEQAVEGALSVSTGGERGRWLADVDFVGCFGVCGRGEHRLHGRHLAVLGA